MATKAITKRAFYYVMEAVLVAFEVYIPVARASWILSIPLHNYYESEATTLLARFAGLNCANYVRRLLNLGVCVESGYALEYMGPVYPDVGPYFPREAFSNTPPLWVLRKHRARHECQTLLLASGADSSHIIQRLQRMRWHFRQNRIRWVLICVLSM